MVQAMLFGARGSGDWTTPDEAPKNYHETLFKLMPDKAPFWGLMSKLPKRTVDSRTFVIFEEDLQQMTAIVSGTIANTTQQIDLKTTYYAAPAKGFKQGDILRNERTGEQVVLLDDPESPYLYFNVITRGSWVTSGGADDKAQMNDGDILRWCGSTYEEITTAPSGISMAMGTSENFIQEFQDAYEISDVADAINIRPEAALSREMRLCTDRHMTKLEYAMFYGKKVTKTGTNGKPIYGTGGLNYWLSTNLIDYSSTGFGLSDLEDGMQQIFKYGSKTKWAFCGATAITYLNRCVRFNSNVNFELSGEAAKDKTWGLSVRSFYSPHGTLQIIPHPLLTESAVGTKEMWIVDPKYVGLAQLKKIGVTKHDKNIKTDDGYTGIKGRLRTLCGLQLAFEKVHAKVTLGTPTA
jgi:hypothetical protein